MKKIALFIFDLDGTLIDSKRDIAFSVHHTMKILGLPPILDEVIYSFVGNGVTPLIQQAVETAGEVDFQEALSIFREHYQAHCLDTTKPFPGILEVIRHFSKTPKVVITNKSQGFSDTIIKGLGMTPSFLGIYGGDTNFPKKPDPALVHHLLQSLGATPESAVIIGDSRVDIETGKNAGIMTCGVTWGFRPKEELVESQPDYLIDRPGDLLNLFK